MLVGAPQPTLGFGVIVRWGTDNELYTLMQKVIVPPAQRPTWIFPGGSLAPQNTPTTTTLTQQDTNLGALEKTILAKCGNGSPPGLPPLELVDSTVVPSRSTTGHTRLFCVLLMRCARLPVAPTAPTAAAPSGWENWRPCPTPAHQHEFLDHSAGGSGGGGAIGGAQQPNQQLQGEVVLCGERFPFVDGHCWMKWATVRKEAKTWNPPQISALNNAVIIWFNHNGADMFDKITAFTNDPSTVATRTNNPQSRMPLQNKVSGGKRTSAAVNNTDDARKRAPCRFFKQGNCRDGEACRFAHVVCRHVQLGETCRHGDACKFSHILPTAAATVATTELTAPATTAPTANANQQQQQETEGIGKQFLGYFHQQLQQVAAQPPQTQAQAAVALLGPLYTPNAQWSHPAPPSPAAPTTPAPTCTFARGSGEIHAQLAQPQTLQRLTVLAAALAVPQHIAVDVQSSSGGATILLMVVGRLPTQQGGAKFSWCFVLGRQQGNNWMVQNELLRSL